MKKLILICLSILLLFAPLASCANSDNNAKETTAAPGNDTTAAETAIITEAITGRSETKDNLPADLNFGNETISIYYRPGDVTVDYDLMGTNNEGDLVTDKVFARNASVEERLKVKLEFTPVAASSLADVRSTIQTMLSTGDFPYDIIVTSGNSIIQTSQNNNLRDLSDFPNLSLDMPWWWSDAINELSPNGKQINYLVGDMMLTNYLKMGVVFFNKTIFNSLRSTEDLYRLTIEDKWTLEKFSQLTYDAYSDKDGNGTPDDSDIYGFIFSQTLQETDIHFLIGCDLKLYNRNDDTGAVTIDMNTQRTIASVDKLYALFSENRGAHSYTKKGIDALDEYFAQDLSLFYPGRLTAVIGANMRKMSSSYGILPFPKLDEAQDGYKSLIHSSSNVVCVPITLAEERTEAVGAVLEALSSEAYRTVTTDFYDIALKTKYSKDELSGQVIDIVAKGATKNFIFEYSPQSGNIIQVPLKAFLPANQGQFSSLYSGAISGAQTKLNEFIAGLN